MAFLRLVAVSIVIAALSPVAVGAPLTFEAADSRLKHAYALAQEADSPTVADRVLHLRDGVKKALDRRDAAAAERLIRDAEEAVGLDPGGRTMLGLPVALVSADTRARLTPLKDRLAIALKREEPAVIAAAVTELERALGGDAGIPDVRRKGDRVPSTAVKPVEVADLFLKVLRADGRTWKALATGTPRPFILPRTYASFVQGCIIIRPLVERHARDNLELFDALVHGACRSMTALQTTDGFFKFPDLRGRHPRFGRTIQRLVDQEAGTVSDGWVTVPLPGGESQFDAGECGIALLRAGAAYQSKEWIVAGLRAADWVSEQQCVPTFHHTACSVSLLCQAYHVSAKRREYLDRALKMYWLGLAPGQTPGGRWINPLDARTSNHVILLRALHDLEEALPRGKDKDAVAAAAGRAVSSLLEEATKLGAPLTTLTVQELHRYTRLRKDATPAARTVLEQAASATIARCRPDGRARAAAPLPELAAVSRVWPE
jgi:hypothetical protein